MTGLLRPNHDRCYHRTYDLSCHQFDALLRRASGRCERCGIDESEAGGARLIIDHEHRIGPAAVRGLICASCNSLMGYVDRGQRPVDPLTNAYLSLSLLAGLPPRPGRTGPTAKGGDGVRVTISLPHWLARLVEEAAEGNVSAWMAASAKDALLRQEVAAVARYEAHHGETVSL